MADKRLSPAAARVLAFLAVGGIILAVLLAVVGHLDADPGYDPLKLTISDYAVSDRGGAVDAAMVVLSLASLALLVGLHTVRVAVRALPASLLLVWIGGLLTSAVIPTDPIGAQMSVAGLIHRYASVSAFVSLPSAAILLSRRLHRDIRWGAISGTLRLLATASAVGLLVMLYVTFPGGHVLLGLVERLLITVEVGLLIVSAVRLYRVTTELTRRRPPVPHDLPAATDDRREASPIGPARTGRGHVARTGYSRPAPTDAPSASTASSGWQTPKALVLVERDTAPVTSR
jgi:hypothetical protein